MKPIIKLLLLLTITFSCVKPREEQKPITGTPYKIEFPTFLGKQASLEPIDNPTTQEGFELGRMLFYDKILSIDQTVSCASCHKQSSAFSDNEQFSTGIQGRKTRRHSMSIVNLLWSDAFFWDGRSISLESQALEPIEDENEMGLPIDEALRRLQNHSDYPARFEKAFGDRIINKERLAKAIAQFERGLVSFNSKFDRYKRGEATFTEQEKRGEQLFFTHPEADVNPALTIRGANCGDCHTGYLTVSNFFMNNGLSQNPIDIGRKEVTGDQLDLGKFKITSMRNIAVRAPYMHDGRFNTLEEVLDHYNDTHLFGRTNVDPLIREASNEHNGTSLLLTEQEKADIIAFLHTLTDEQFLKDERFSDPF